MNKNNHQKVEKKWQKHWEAMGAFRATESGDKPKYYGLIEFPYPSGDGLHVGHVRSYTALDVIARQKRLAGFNVLYPIGWDAFGLPAENYAIKHKVQPADAVAANVKVFKKQIQSLGISFDWDREINTTEPKYFKWTQWIFLKLLEKGLAYKKKMPINWCPKCKIGLANEEVIDGRCERCGTETFKKDVEQWMLKITAYADRLIDDLATVDFLDKIKTSQINWIGRSEGAEVDFEIKDYRLKIKVFTTRPDTLFGVSYMVLSPEHELVSEITTAEQMETVKEYQLQARKKSDLERTQLAKEKTGVFTGAYAVNPVTKKEVPIWIADYVLANYGTGAIMAVPAHDERDFEFAKKFDLPILPVVAPLFVDNDGPDAVRPDKKTVRRRTAYVFLKHWSEDKYLCLNWTKFGWHSGIIGGVDDGEDFAAAAGREILEETGYTNFEFVRNIGYELHNNFFAAHKDENRYAVGQVMLFQLKDNAKVATSEAETKNHEAVWVEAENIEKYLNMQNFLYAWNILNGKESECFQGEGVAINSDFLNDLKTPEAAAKMIAWLEENGCGKATKQYKLRDWVFSRQHYWGEPIPVVFCDKCGTVPLPESELPLELPKVKNYEPTDTGESPLAKIESWVKTTCPHCGGFAKRETDTMPNWAGSSWYFLRYTDPRNDQSLADMEKMKYWLPIDLYNGGMEHTTLHLLYSRFWNKFLFDCGIVPVSEPYQRRVSHGMILAPDGEKMSKSRGNVINPDTIVEEFGADVLRVYEMFIGPYDQAVAWDTNSISGVKRFLDRVYKFEKFIDNDNAELLALLHRTIKKVTEDILDRRFNTAVSALMILLNKMEELGATNATFILFLTLLSPFAPHLAEEKNEMLDNKQAIVSMTWPVADESLIKDETIEIAIQINGKVRERVIVSPEISEEDLKSLVLKNEKVLANLAGKEVRKFIYVKGKLVSLVV